MNPFQQAHADYLKFKKDIGFKKDPALIDIDGGMSFFGFIGFATGQSEGAKHLFDEFAKGRDIGNLTAKQNGELVVSFDCKQLVAEYVDWLIVNHFGEDGNEVEEANA